MTWEDTVDRAIGDAKFGYPHRIPEQDEFINTFLNFYDELFAEFQIIEVPDNHREKAERRANVAYVDDIP